MSVKLFFNVVNESTNKGYILVYFKENQYKTAQGMLKNVLYQPLKIYWSIGEPGWDNQPFSMAMMSLKGFLMSISLARIWW